MAKIRHVLLPNKYLHDWKDVATATIRSTYHKLNAENPTNKWHRKSAAQISFDGGGTPFTIAAPTAFTRIDPTTIGSGLGLGGTEGTTGLVAGEVLGPLAPYVPIVSYAIVLSHTDASSRDIEVALGTDLAVFQGGLPQNVHIQKATQAQNDKRIFYARKNVFLGTPQQVVGVWVKCAAGDIKVHKFLLSVEHTIFLP